MSNNLPDDTDLKQETLDFMEEVEADLESPEVYLKFFWLLWSEMLPL